MKSTIIIPFYRWTEFTNWGSFSSEEDVSRPTARQVAELGSKPSASESRAFAVIHSTNSYNASQLPGYRPGTRPEEAFTGAQGKEEKKDNVLGFS